MLNAIELTKHGEVLLPPDGTEDREDVTLTARIGVHKHCEGYIDILHVAQLYYAIVCRRCALRIIIPIPVDTWKRLEAHFKQCKV